MVIVLNPKGFKLPRVEKEKFVLLIRLGIDYNREQCLYSIKNYNNIEKLIETISEYFEIEVDFSSKLHSVRKRFSCSDCNYNDLCTTRDMPFSCVCPHCLRDRKHFEEYLEKL